VSLFKSRTSQCQGEQDYLLSEITTACEKGGGETIRAKGVARGTATSTGLNRWEETGDKFQKPRKNSLGVRSPRLLKSHPRLSGPGREKIQATAIFVQNGQLGEAGRRLEERGESWVLEYRELKNK